ncbi:T-cell receptor gamma chain C region C7.5 [Sorex araneus]|uniref:T-cell receptor gamma chain C region C7.5 n=1 Tax=Sorex araneus TaxID=42254 RepID=UPI00243375BF|nr:T-cell receptor gamma chain C region C7.5 [Sorex araneus]
MSSLKAVIFSFFWAFSLGQMSLEQPEKSVSMTLEKSATISCKMHNGDFYNAYIHWYRQKRNKNMERLIYVSTTTPANRHIDGKSKLVASKNTQTSTATLIIKSLEKEDEATYYCAYCDSTGWIKIFGEGTKLIVIPRDKNLDGDFSPKPTVFLPSPAEISLHKTGTYLCLLEKFFPDVIKIDWKEENGDTMLDSQQGDIMKTGDTYMKFSWLTVTGQAMGKKHKCIVKHEFNKRGIDQEILFPSIRNGILSRKMTVCFRIQYEELQLLFTINSAYYTYIFLLFKSTLYLAIVTFCLFRTTAMCGNGKNS